ncbi:hypothetical protein [Streptomyces arboris]|uniref:hypothetical protein n=1 Tax=Streptomyces arboris TaxID=2600619 RepID=UPI00363AF51B
MVARRVSAEKAQDPPRGHDGREGSRLRRPRRRPRRLALIPDGESRPRLSAPLESALAARIGALLADAPATGEHRAETGETYTALATGLVVEVLAGTGRHGTLNVVRAR